MNSRNFIEYVPGLLRRKFRGDLLLRFDGTGPFSAVKVVELDALPMSGKTVTDVPVKRADNAGTQV